MSLQDKMKVFYDDHSLGQSTDLVPFRENRQFYAFDIFPEIAAGGTRSYKFVVGKDIIVDDLALYIFAGSAGIEIFAEATEGTAFGTSVPIFNKNNTSTAPSNSSACTLSTGGDFSGGVLIGANQAKETSIPIAFIVDKLRNDIRGFAPQTIFVRLTGGAGSLLESGEGNVRIAWEEV